MIDILFYCRSGKHAWTDSKDSDRCCDPEYVRVQGLSLKDLEDLGAENIVHRQMWRGWQRLRGGAKS